MNGTTPLSLVKQEGKRALENTLTCFLFQRNFCLIFNQQELMMKNRVPFWFREKKKLKSWVVHSNYILMQNALTNAKIRPSLPALHCSFRTIVWLKYDWNGSSDLQDLLKVSSAVHWHHETIFFHQFWLVQFHEKQSPDFSFIEIHILLLCRCIINA